MGAEVKVGQAVSPGAGSRAMVAAAAKPAGTQAVAAKAVAGSGAAVEAVAEMEVVGTVDLEMVERGAEEAAQWDPQLESEVDMRAPET